MDGANVYFNSQAIVNGYFVPNGVTPSVIMGSMQAPINQLNQQINVMLNRIQSNPTPNQADILQLQLLIGQYNNLLLASSQMLKAYYDTEKQIIGNIGT